METGDVLKKAWAAVQDAGLPPEVQPVAFREAVRLLAPRHTAPAPTAAPHSDGRGNSGRGRGEDRNDSNGGREGPVASEDQIYDRVVAQTGVDRGRLEQLVHLDDDLRVSLPGLKLGKSNSERARAVAQLLTITRGFGLEENETPLEVIRAECDRLKVYDSANFSSHMKALSGYVLNGTGQNRRLRAKGPGIQAFPGLVDGLLGDS